MSPRGVSSSFDGAAGSVSLSFSPSLPVSVSLRSSVMPDALPGGSVTYVLEPPPIAPRELTGRVWDAVVVGGGHNGLTAAAYLARAGRSVVVLERRTQLGGACTLERPFGDPRAIVSPCAYLVGLLDRTVVAELDLARHGYRVTLADPNLWCPLPDGRTVAQYLDPARTAEHLRGQGFSARDVEGVVAYEELFERLRVVLRDAWSGPSPSRDELVALAGEDASVLFEDSVADVLARHVQDPDLQAALVGQGVIGTMAGPRDPGTAAIHLMHSMGEVEGVGGAWGYVEGGMGRVSAALAAAATEAGAVLAVDAPVASVLPGEGVVLESGERILGRAVVSNADPKRLLAMLPDAPAAFADRVAAWRTDSPVVKLNALLGRLPTWTAAAEGERPERAMISITAGVDGMQAAADACRAGAAAVGFCELYVHTAYDASIAPPGQAHAERLRAVRAVRHRHRRRGRARARRDRRARAGRARLHRGARGPGAARHRGAHRAHRRAHLPGRGAARSDVGPALGAANRHRRRVPVRRRHAPGRIGHRAERSQRGAGRAQDLG